MIEIILTISMFLLLAVLWTIDTAETCRLVDVEGIDVEENPIARFFLKLSDRDFIIFKIFDLAMLGTIMYYIYLSNMIVAESLLFLFTLIYTYTVVHNYLVIRRYEGE